MIKSDGDKILTSMATGKFTVPVQNQFDILGDDDDMNNDDEINSDNGTPQTNKNITEKKSRVPPIVLMNVNMNGIREKMTELQIKHYNVKFQTIGTKLFLESKPEWDKVRELLMKTKTTFFTHDDIENKPIKMICSGLPRFDVNFIKEEITSQNNLIGAAIIDIKSFELRHKKFDNEINHIFYFKKGVKINDIRKVKSIGNVIVHWSHFINKRNSPTQCRRCQLYGHGTRNCNLNPRCKYCSLGHFSDSCPLLENGETNIKPDTLKCANCGANHSANDPTCENKSNFIKIRDKLQQQRQPRASQRTFKNFDMTNDFPELRPTSRAVSSHQPGPVIKPKPFTHNPNLFTYAEITSLLHEAISKLSNCNTKEEQFQTVMELSIKYLYNQDEQPKSK